ncbi:hypothetical protein F8388_012164 [Cannabis sativa]|uniref:DUF4283 domain-containing protein n=1 Tax=Cannabis sativa TaxID=3483 RepID=A0A7J6E215_CANSA|nr:hypothetical protein F8388_012164 [Cannabis sativa]KAF4361513.1 hypothetical protein G4B88_016723 [Cannabis sativa]
MHRGGSHGPSGHGWHRNPTGFEKKKGQHPTGFGWQNLSKHIDNIGLHKYWSFQTKHKVFMTTLTGDGGAVRVCERTRHFGFEVTVTIDAVAWILDTLQEMKGKKRVLLTDFKRSFRNSTASYFLECFSNRKGEFLKLSVLRNNKIKAVIIPEEESATGWSDLRRCLNGVMGRKSESQQVSPRQYVNEKEVRNATKKQTWANVVKNSMKNVPKNDQRNRDCKAIEQGNSEVKKPMDKQAGTLRKFLSKPSGRRKSDIEGLDLYPAINPSFKPKNPYPEKRFQQPKLYEYMRSKAQKRNWKLAIILTRDNSHVSWSVIFYNLSRELGRKLMVSQLFDDRCIVWCKDEKERDVLTQIQQLRVPGAQTVVSFSQWSWEAQMESIKVECKDSWIGIYGLPLSLWNMKTFRRIGECCGGLLDVDKESAEASLLSHVRLQLMGDENGFVPESLNLEHEDSKVELKLFKLNDLNYRFHGYFRTCWYQDFDHN